MQKQLKAPFVAYADFECILQQHQQVGGTDVDTQTYIKEESRKSNTQVFQEHIPFNFTFKVTFIDPDYNPKIVVYMGEDAADQFNETLQAQASDIYNHYIKNPKPVIPLTIDEEEQFNQAESCHICSEPLGADRVRDHCHVLGLYRGEGHNACNLNYRIDPAKWKLPVILHNLRGYDSYLIIKGLKMKYGGTRGIATNMESYITFSVGQLQFLDSMQFTNASLEKVATTLSRVELMYTKESFTDANQCYLELITDIDMYTFIEGSIRGGISMISTRCAANLPDIKELRTHLIYLDANKLCGWTMSHYLPTRGFKFLAGEEVRSQFPSCDINTHLASIYDTADTGYILEMDLEYPSTLHGSHNDYPLAVKSLEISGDIRRYAFIFTTGEIPS